MELQEIVMELKRLKELIEIIDSNLKFNINVFIILLTLFLAIGGWALSLFAKSIVEKRVQKQLSEMKNDLKQELSGEIKEIRGEVYTFKNSFDHYIFQLVENIPNIKWASGSVVNDKNDLIYIGGLNGNIDWNSTITNVRVIDKINRKEIPSELIDKRENSFTLKITQEVSTKNLEWIIVWYDKSN